MAIHTKVSTGLLAAVCVFGLISSQAGVAGAQDSGSTGAPSAAPPASMPSVTSDPATIQLGQIEAQQRAQVNETGFFTDYSQLTNSGGQYADARYVLGQSSPALFTLPGDGISQGIVTLSSCGLFSPHYHPRGSEVIYVSQGNVRVSFVEENAVTVGGVTYGGRILNYTMPAGSSVVVPQGLMHFIYNPSCANATVVTSFANRDPGTVSIVQNLFRLDTTIVQAATGLQGQLQDAVRTITNNTPIIGVDSACLATCPNATKAAPAQSSSG